MSERKSSFEIKCRDIEVVEKYMIDGCFDTSTDVKCDYLFYYHPNNKNSYVFVELKGSDFEHGIEQINVTVKRFVDNDFFVGKNNLEVTGVLVCTQYPKNNSKTRSNKKDVKNTFPHLNFKMLYGKTKGKAIYNPDTRETE